MQSLLRAERYRTGLPTGLGQDLAGYLRCAVDRLHSRRHCLLCVWLSLRPRRSEVEELKVEVEVEVELEVEVEVEAEVKVKVKVEIEDEDENVHRRNLTPRTGICSKWKQF